MDKLEKIAWGGSLAAPLRMAGSLVNKIPGSWRDVAGSAATGGVLGSATGGWAGYRDAKQQGASTTDALKAGVIGGAKGGAIGGAIGGGIGTGSRLLRGDTAPVMSGANASGMLHSMDKSIADFGRRQLHAVTGHVPSSVTDEASRAKYLQHIGYGGRTPPREMARMAEESLANVDKTDSWAPKFLRKAYHKYDKFTSNQYADSLEALNRSGATSLPGYVKAMADSSKRKDLLRSAKGELLSGGVLGGMGVLGTAQGLHSAIKGEPAYGSDPNAPVDRWGNIGMAAGNMAGLLVPSFTMPIGMVLQPNIAHAGQRIGSTIGKTFGKIPAMSAPDTTDPVASPTPAYSSSMSAAASGQPYGGGISQ